MLFAGEVGCVAACAPCVMANAQTDRGLTAMFRILLRYSFNGDDGSVTTPFDQALTSLGFGSAGTGLRRATNLDSVQLQQFFALLSSKANGGTTSKGGAVTVDHFIIVVESI